MCKLAYAFNEHLRFVIDGGLGATKVFHNLLVVTSAILGMLSSPRVIILSKGLYMNLRSILQNFLICILEKIALALPLHSCHVEPVGFRAIVTANGV